MHATNFNSPLLPQKPPILTDNQFDETQVNIPLTLNSLASAVSSSSASDSSVATCLSFVKNIKHKHLLPVSNGFENQDVLSINGVVQSSSSFQNNSTRNLVIKIYKENKSKSESNKKLHVANHLKELFTKEKEPNLEQTLKESPEISNFIIKRKKEIDIIKTHINEKYQNLRNEWIAKLLKVKEAPNSSSRKPQPNGQKESPPTKQEKDCSIIVERFLSISKHQNAKFSKGAADIPEYIFDSLHRLFKQYNNNNMLINDPAGHYKEEETWSRHQKKLFIQNYLKYPKQFGKIATFIEGRTSQQCVLFYYKNKKELNLKNRLIGLKRSEFIKKHQNVFSTEKKMSNSEKIPRNSKGSALLYSIEISSKKNKPSNKPNSSIQRADHKPSQNKEITTEFNNSLSNLLSPLEDSPDSTPNKVNAKHSATVAKPLQSKFIHHVPKKSNHPLKATEELHPQINPDTSKGYTQSASSVSKVVSPTHNKSDSEIFTKEQVPITRLQPTPVKRIHLQALQKTPDEDSTIKSPHHLNIMSESRLDFRKVPIPNIKAKIIHYIPKDNTSPNLPVVYGTDQEPQQAIVKMHNHELKTDIPNNISSNVFQVANILNHTPSLVEDEKSIQKHSITPINNKEHTKKALEPSKPLNQKRKINKDLQLQSILQPTEEEMAEKKQKPKTASKSAPTINNLLTTSVDVENTKWSNHDIFKWFENSS